MNDPNNDDSELLHIDDVSDIQDEIDEKIIKVELDNNQIRFSRSWR